MENNNKKEPIVLYGSRLKCSKMHEVNIVIKKKKSTIIKGNVYNEQHEPSIWAAVEVKEINCLTECCKILGYCFTDYKGEYLFLLQPACGRRYEISIYSPLV
ncbi:MULTISPECIES: hypothetical protein [Clostridium]|uniref:Uncharacterized protein n=1 Tax=Clostridium aquiflavi TaxID=3073603 RepID=A0ABU1EC56_9CLOT|nr:MULTISPECIES: hypothetical protein [unclassified Clostridium]MDR5585907.1 hypothetical protein [Clostridium sp. 5N-1]NFG60907.1 hypothetical protein [Clostridium botulinum]NFQ09508.1 hypothetical protein [Clostridium botulinum]